MSCVSDSRQNEDYSWLNKKYGFSREGGEKAHLLGEICFDSQLPREGGETDIQEGLLSLVHIWADIWSLVPTSRAYDQHEHN